ncbi:YhgE/Pip domain-containing protein [Neobacillus sp. DY30]|uniref:YhgE/Pip domain-containing protein n=1 Tax=Neobacillus sp. DY30 TaxID=3047871 RepID=UPI0024BFCC97|nr:YhgE/Pip domain-containing protein [Neobacillus sp. DY30]WHY00475.1 YhgE/Pip domain-containing protein [Neobacillus sp. DY30]
MKGLKAELKSIFTNRKVLIPIIAILFIPVLYAGMFLWAFWDPYKYLGDLPVAIVNQDKGAELAGERLEIGDDLVKNLKKSNTFDFDIVDKEKGYKGLEDQKYYILVEIPSDFSKNATTLLEDQPEKLQIKYVPNEGANFLSAQIGETAMKEIKAEISKQIVATYSESIFEKVTEMGDGLAQASEGAGQLNEGSVKLNEGAGQIKENLQTLASKSIEFEEGMNSAATGSKEVAQGTMAIQQGLKEVDEKLPQLVTGTEKAQAGAEQIKKELPAGIAAEINSQLAGSTGKLNGGINQFENQLGAGLSAQIADQMIAQQTAKMQELAAALIANGVPAETVTEIMAQQTAPSKAEVQQQVAQAITPGLHQGFTQFKTQVNGQLLGATDGLETKLKQQTDPVFDQLIGGIGEINANQVKLQQGIHQIYSGSTALNAGANQLTAGMGELSAGAGKITEGTGKLAEGSAELQAGTEKLQDGTSELNEKLSQGAEAANSVHADDDTYDMMGEPVKVDKNEINTVPNYGTGFAPYFVSLGLFVGALIISIVFGLREPAVKPASASQWFFGKLGVITIIGVLQALLVDFVLLVGLGIEVQNLPLFILTTIITSMVFVTLIQMLVTTLADVGRFIAILILIMQLTTSAGTFPLALIPEALQPFNAFFPMTYTVQAFKAVISSGDFAYMWHNNAILLAYMAGFMGVTFTYMAIRFKKNKTNISMLEQAA